MKELLRYFGKLESFEAKGALFGFETAGNVAGPNELISNLETSMRTDGCHLGFTYSYNPYIIRKATKKVIFLRFQTPMSTYHSESGSNNIIMV